MSLGNGAQTIRPNQTTDASTTAKETTTLSHPENVDPARTTESAKAESKRAVVASAANTMEVGRR